MTLVDTVLMMLNHLQIPYRLLGTKVQSCGPQTPGAPSVRITSQQSSFRNQRLVGPAVAAVRHTVPVA